MSATVERLIWDALRARVETLPLSFAKAWPATNFTPVSTTPYLEIRHLPNTVQRPFIGSNDPHLRPGILQISLMYPISSTHSHEHRIQFAGQIAAHFNTDLGMTAGGVTVRVQKAPDIAQPFVDGAFHRYPVTVRYEASK